MSSTVRCPRCSAPRTAEFYGPCDRCRADLRRSADERAAGRSAVRWVAQWMAKASGHDNPARSSTHMIAASVLGVG